MVRFRYGETIVFEIHSKFTYDRSSRSKVFVKIGLQKEIHVKFAEFLNKIFHRTPLVTASVVILKSMIWRNFISFQFKLYLILRVRSHERRNELMPV